MLIIVVLSTTCVSAQKNGCKCIGNGYDKKKPDTAFFFTNGYSIALCGFREEQPDIFSEFVLVNCESRKAIDFWNATTTCRISYSKDTLYVEELLNLPTGKNFRYQQTVWSTEKIYWVKNKLWKDFVINMRANAYSSSDIEIVLAEYGNAEGGLNDEKMILANKLFIASLSDNVKAMEYFRDFETRFGALDGAFKEEYNDLKTRLNLWSKK